MVMARAVAVEVADTRVAAGTTAVAGTRPPPPGFGLPCARRARGRARGALATTPRSNAVASATGLLAHKLE